MCPDPVDTREPCSSTLADEGAAGWDPVALLLRDPSRYADLLSAYRFLLGASTNAGHAIEQADSGGQPNLDGVDLDDPVVGLMFKTALSDVRTERERRDRNREQRDRTAAALLLAARLGGLTHEAA
jgi:hypothetical protein